MGSSSQRSDVIKESSMAGSFLFLELNMIHSNPIFKKNFTREIVDPASGKFDKDILNNVSYNTIDV